MNRVASETEKSKARTNWNYVEEIVRDRRFMFAGKFQLIIPTLLAILRMFIGG